MAADAHRGDEHERQKAGSFHHSSSSKIGPRIDRANEVTSTARAGPPDVSCRDMPARLLDAEIDRLYQLPLDEFTAARNVLAKQAGGEAGRVRALGKPSVPAWIVNQLYWRDRKVWDALV